MRTLTCWIFLVVLVEVVVVMVVVFNNLKTSVMFKSLTANVNRPADMTVGRVNVNVTKVSETAEVLEDEVNSTWTTLRPSDRLPRIYVITPTYPRPEQIPELTRLSHTLMLVPNIHWLVVEDATVKNPQVSWLLSRTHLSFSHLLAPMPRKYKNHRIKPKGVSNRNRGLRWLRKHAVDGVFYFADDDNTYDLEIFEEMRSTKKVSMWPVGLFDKFGLNTPVVRDGILVGFYGWIGYRAFPVDMAGFAVSVEFLLQRPKAEMPYEVSYEETGFFESLAPFDYEDIELKADNCTKILVWHTQTVKIRRAANIDPEVYQGSNLIQLRELIVGT